MALPLNTRYLTIRLQIDGQTFGGSGNNTKFITANSGRNDNGGSYLAADIVIQKSIGLLNDTATLKIYGMSVSDINSFTRTNLTGAQALYSGNQVTVYAGYNLGSDGLPPIIYHGFVLRAGADYNSGRDRPFIMTTMQNFYYQNKISIPINVQGTISLDNLYRTIATNAGLYYHSRNVKGIASNPIYIGDPRTQLQQSTAEYGYYYKTITENLNNDTVFVAPIGEPLTDTKFIIQESSGMIGYPVIEDYGCSVKVYFNPNLQIGQSIVLNSTTVDYVNNITWYINGMQHILQNKESDWYSILQLNTQRYSKGAI